MIISTKGSFISKKLHNNGQYYKQTNLIEKECVMSEKL